MRSVLHEFYYHNGSLSQDVGLICLILCQILLLEFWLRLRKRIEPEHYVIFCTQNESFLLFGRNYCENCLIVVDWIHLSLQAAGSAVEQNLSLWVWRGICINLGLNDPLIYEYKWKRHWDGYLPQIVLDAWNFWNNFCKVTALVRGDTRPVSVWVMVLTRHVFMAQP